MNRQLLMPFDQRNSEMSARKWILTEGIEFDSCHWLSWRSVFSWSYQATVNFISLRVSNSQGGGLGVVICKCPFNGTLHNSTTFFPCYSCFSFQIRNFAGYSGACADKCIFAYCLDIWMILIKSEVNLYRRSEENMFSWSVQFSFIN